MLGAWPVLAVVSMVAPSSSARAVAARCAAVLLRERP
jgi:hypothetical protein